MRFKVDFNEIVKKEQLVPINNDEYIYALKTAKASNTDDIKTSLVVYNYVSDIFYDVVFTSHDQKIETQESEEDYFKKYRDVPFMNHL